MSHKKNLVALAILMVLTTLFAASNVGPYNILPKIVPALAVLVRRQLLLLDKALLVTPLLLSQLRT